MTQFYRSRRWRQILLILASIYIGAIWVWFVLRVIWFDGIWWLSLLNTHAFYLVVPSLVLLPIAIYRGLRYRSSKLAIVGFALPFILFFYSVGATSGSGVRHRSKSIQKVSKKIG